MAKLKFFQSTIVPSLEKVFHSNEIHEIEEKLADILIKNGLAEKVENKIKKKQPSKKAEPLQKKADE